MTTKLKLDVGRLNHIRDLADERRAIAQNAFERMRETADALKAARAALVLAEEDTHRGLPGQREYFLNAAAKARAAFESAEESFHTADKKYWAAAEVAETAGRLHARCREFAIAEGLIPHPQGGVILKAEAVA